MFTKIPPNELNENKLNELNENENKLNKNNICENIYDVCKKTEYNIDDYMINCYFAYIKCNNWYENKILKQN